MTSKWWEASCAAVRAKKGGASVHPDEVLPPGSLKAAASVTHENIASTAPGNWLDSGAVNAFFREALKGRESVVVLPASAYSLPANGTYTCPTCRGETAARSRLCRRCNTLIPGNTIESGYDTQTFATTNIGDVDLARKRMVCVPIHEAVHWLMGVVDHKAKTFEVHDCQGVRNARYVALFAGRMADMFRRLALLHGTPALHDYETYQHLANCDPPGRAVRVHNDGASCGAWAIAFATHRVLGIGLDEVPVHALALREWIVTTLMTRKLSWDGSAPRGKRRGEPLPIAQRPRVSQQQSSRIPFTRLPPAQPDLTTRALAMGYITPTSKEAAAQLFKAEALIAFNIFDPLPAFTGDAPRSP
jgi:hypothetical protein